MLKPDRRSLWRNSVWQCRMLVVLACCQIAACTAQADRMIVASGDTKSPFPEQWSHGMCVRSVEGGETFNLLSQPGVVESEAFRSAFEQTLERQLLLAAPKECKYYIDVDILGVSQPSHGIFITSVEAISHVNYKVFDLNQRPVLLDTVSASYTAQFSESMIGASRVQRASEGAVRASFEKFLEDLRTKPPLATASLTTLSTERPDVAAFVSLSRSRSAAVLAARSKHHMILHSSRNSRHNFALCAAIRRRS